MVLSSKPGCPLTQRWSGRQVVGARATALETVLLLRQIVSSAKFNSLEQLVAIVKVAGKQLVQAQPKGKLLIFLHYNNRSNLRKPQNIVLEI